MSVTESAESRDLKERVVEINRVAKVVKGGRRFSFTALVVIGDEHDKVGVGYGKAREVPLAISKAVDDAKKNLFTVPRHGTTITHRIVGRVRRGARAAAAGQRGDGRHRRRRCARGARACRDPRHPREEPRHDEPDQHVKATVNGLQNLRRPEDVAKTRGLRISDVLPPKKKVKEDEQAEAPVAVAEAPAEEAPAAEETTETTEETA